MNRNTVRLFAVGFVLIAGGMMPAASARAQAANPTNVSIEDGASTDAPTDAPTGGAPANGNSPGAEALNSAVEDAQREMGVDLTNPFSIAGHAGEVLSSLMGESRGVVNDDITRPPGSAADLPDAGLAPTAAQGKPGLSSTLSILMLLTVLTMVPAVLVMCTSFTRIVVVLALLRQALGTQQLPPTQVITGLALFLTLLVMSPTINQINEEVIKPLNAGTIDEQEAWATAKRPIRHFMFQQIDRSGNWGSVYTIMEWRDPGSTMDKAALKREDVDMLTLVPAFMISELKVAFLMGFRLYLPFLVIDMVVSSVLISMGMLMLPPVLISLPFKLLLFVLVDGWNLLVANLLTSFDVSTLPATG